LSFLALAARFSRSCRFSRSLANRACSIGVAQIFCFLPHLRSGAIPPFARTRIRAFFRAMQTLPLVGALILFMVWWGTG
jgi:hypothetical protein